MAGLVPGIHVFTGCIKEDVDGRDKPGHDGDERTYVESLKTAADASPKTR
jgi:hypothetical protein